VDRATRLTNYSGFRYIGLRVFYALLVISLIVLLGAGFSDLLARHARPDRLAPAEAAQLS